MNKFEVTILGCGSALPTTKYNQTSQVINFRENLFMIDCGEATQLQFRKAKFKFTRLGHIFISHLHGDHCFGLMGLISTFGMMGRTADLHIYSPKGLKELMLPLLGYFCKQNSFEVIFHEFNTKKHALIYEDRSLEVYTLPLKHRIPCAGFYFVEKPGLNHIIREQIDYYQVPTYEINRLRAGFDYILPSGEIISNSKLTKPAQSPRSYAYCSDTAYYEPVVELIKGANLLFHEATFANTEKLRAKQTNHSTAEQAASIAKLSSVKRLLIGHFSARYPDVSCLKEEAEKVFPSVIVAKELVTYVVD